MNPKTMKYGPHSDHVEALLVALRDPAIRRRARGPLTSLWDMDAVAQTVYHRLRAAVRLQAWDDARVTAASVATPSHWQAASGAVLVLVASDLISDDAWDRYTDTSLARLISIQRPAGPLSERCPCGHQLGERLLAARVHGTDDASWARLEQWTECDHLVPSLPTIASLEIAKGLAPTWVGNDWYQLLRAARALAGEDPVGAT